MGKFAKLGNELYNGKKSIDFVGRRWLWYGISGVILLVAILGLTVRGLNMGIEFTGGAQFSVTVPSDRANQELADKIREDVADSGIENASSPIVTTQGSQSIVVQTEDLSEEETNQLTELLMEETGASEQDISQDEIGASWGAEVAERSIIGLIVFLVLVMVFIWAYFREWKMALAAVTALLHDLVITIGIYALSGFEVTPSTVTGLLTILGFSLYDTVVVFDKVRENTKNLKASHMSYDQAANLAVNQTLVRSINTSIVALIPVGVILYVAVTQLGSSSLQDLSLALFVGTAAGVYSSIFIATPMLAQLKRGETEVQQAERRAKARERNAVDKYAAVPAFSESMAVDKHPGGEGVEFEDEYEDAEYADSERDAREAGLRARGGSRAVTDTSATGRGRVAPEARGPVRESKSSGRTQPVRKPKSKRDKK